MILTIVNNTLHDMKLFDARHLELLSEYDYASLKTPEMLEKLEKHVKIKKTLIEIKAREKISCLVTGFDEYYIYSPLGVCTVSSELNEIDVSSTGRLVVTQPRPGFIVIF